MFYSLLTGVNKLSCKSGSGINDLCLLTRSAAKRLLKNTPSVISENLTVTFPSM